MHVGWRCAALVKSTEYLLADLRATYHGNNVTLAHSRVDALNAAVVAGIQQWLDELKAKLEAIAAAIFFPIAILVAEMCLAMPAGGASCFGP